MPDRGKVLRVGDMFVVLPGKSVDEIFLMSLCLVVSLPIIIGAAPAPGSLAEALPAWQVLAWSISLFVGALTILISFTFKDRILGVIIEQFGSVCLAAASSLYGTAIVLNEASRARGGLVSAAILFGFAVARLIQFRQHQKTLEKVHLVKTMIEKGEVNGI